MAKKRRNYWVVAQWSRNAPCMVVGPYSRKLEAQTRIGYMFMIDSTLKRDMVHLVKSKDLADKISELNQLEIPFTDEEE